MVPRAILGVVVAAVALIAAALLVVLVLAPVLPQALDDGGEDAPPQATWAPPVALPVAAATPAGGGAADLVDADWLAATAAATGIPSRALAAYAGVALLKNQITPTCGLSWTTLAAIGYVESRHGTHGGSAVGPDGTVTPGIFGIALDGGSTDEITDTDGGAIDGDAVYDRAVGPMQLIPQTWKNWHVDVSGDGIEDPQNIDDATMATASYLCRASPDMTTESGWRAGIAAYNGAESYLRAVATAAVGYAP